MGVELHITRAEFWPQNEGTEITADEWLSYVAADPELRRRPENGQYFVVWLGQSKYEEPWLDWFQGNVNTKWPDTTLDRKMLSIAVALGGRVQDDDGTVYVSAAEWEYDPSERINNYEAQTKPSWWKRLLGK